MRANKKEPVSAPFWFQSLSIHVARMAASYVLIVCFPTARLSCKQVPDLSLIRQAIVQHHILL